MWINMNINRNRILLGTATLFWIILPHLCFSLSDEDWRDWQVDSHTSLGALVLGSEMIVRGEVGEVAGSWGATIQFVQQRGKLVLVEKSRVLYGPALDSKTIEAAFGENVDVPAEGTEVILFLSRRWIPEIHTSRRRLSIEEANRQRSYNWGHWKLVGGSRGIIEGSSDRLEYFEQVVDEYVGHLKDELDFVEYVEFLYRLSKSTDERVRIDGWWHDWNRLLGWAEWRDNIAEAEADELLPGTVVERLEQIRKRAELSISVMSRESAEAVFEEADFYSAVESGDRMRIMLASRDSMGQLSTQELKKYSDLWVPHMRELLHSDDEDIAWSAASLLSVISDPSGAPIMIQRLRDQKSPNPDISLRELQRATGKDFPYDQEAPEDVREAQIQVWEEWWESEGKEKAEEFPR